jgi:hypothetical protein
MRGLTSLNTLFRLGMSRWIRAIIKFVFFSHSSPTYL